MPHTRILLADDHPLFRRGVSALLAREPDLEVVGETASGAETLEAVERLRPDLVLLDLTLPAPNGLETAALLRESEYAPAVLFLSGMDDAASVRRALQAGARGFVSKTIDPALLVECVRATHRGERVFAGLQDTDFLNPQPPTENPLDRLSPREFQVLERLATGERNQAIASALGISTNTVKVHLRHILAKLEVENRVQAAALFMRSAHTEPA